MNLTIKKLVKPVLESCASVLGPHARSASCPSLWLLMYHRVLPASDQRYSQEEPGMLLRPETLQMHIQELRRQFELVSLTDWVNTLQQGGALPSKACAITFDDGWSDNYEYAFPVLRALVAPATVFAVAQKIGTNFQFWPNIVASLLVSGAIAQMAAHPLLAASVTAIPGTADPPLIATVIRKLKIHSDHQLHVALEEIDWRAHCESMPASLMSWEQLREIRESGLVDVGSHTCTHSRLTRLTSPGQLQFEIVESKRILEAQLGAPVDLFCFPDGDYDDAALSLVKQHYRAAVTTRRGINRLDSLRPHELSRIALHDQMSASRRLFRARLSAWI